MIGRNIKLEGRQMDSEQIKELLQILEEYGKLSHEIIATMMELPVEIITSTIKQLEDKKVILKYPTLINWEQFEPQKTIKAMIEVKVTPEREVGFDDIAARIYKFPEVQAVYLMSGSYDFSIIFEGKSIKDIATFISQKVSTLDNVISTATHFILKKYKHDGVIYNSDEEDKRIIFTP